MHVVHDAPNPDSPDELFRDGPHTYEVATLPAALPAVFTQATGLETLILVLGSGLAAFRMDQRLKIVTLRRRSGRPGWPRVVHVEL
jgi:hypothetical protein